MQFTENSEEIIIRHVPVKEWLIGGVLTFFCAIFCLFILYSLLVAPRGYYESLLGEWLGILSGLLAASFFLLFVFFEIKMIRTPLTTVLINRKSGSVDITYRRFYGTDKQRFYFHQIQKFKSYKVKRTSSVYFPALVLANKEVIKFKIPISSDKKNMTRLTGKFNKFVKTKEPAEKQ